MRPKSILDDDPGYLHIDISYGPKIDGKKMYLYVAIDRATRLLYVEIHEDKKAATAAQFLENVLDFYPFLIEKILTDNGREFTLKNHLGNKDSDLKGAFDLVCERHDIEHRTTLPAHPWTNGCVEKVNDTIKSKTVKVTHYATKSDMEEDVQTFVRYYNFERKHSSLVKEKKGKTPFDALVMYYIHIPEIFFEDPLAFRRRICKQE